MTPSRRPVAAEDTLTRWPLPVGPLAGFLLAIFALVLMAVMSQRSQDQASHTVARVLHSNEVMGQLQTVLSALKDAETGQRGYLLTGDQRYLDPFRQGVSDLPAALDRAAALVGDSPEQMRRLGRLRQLANAKVAELTRTIELRSQGDAAAALQVVRTDEGKVLMDSARQTIGELQREERALLAQRQSDMQRAQEQAALVIYGGMALLLLLIVGSAYTTGRDFRTRERENWIRQGIGDLADVLQANGQVGSIASDSAAFFVQRCGAAIGAVYVSDRSGTGLQLRGGCALPPGVPQRVVNGEGLTGQCAQNGQVVVVTDVPAGHLPVASTLGTSAPRALVLCPAGVEGRTEAVLELGFLAPLRPEALELLKRAQYTFALAIRNAKEREQTEALLEETQRQSEELQTQQEELRVSNEELEEQSRALQQAQAESEAQQTELSLTNTQLEERTQELELQRQSLLQAHAHLQHSSGLLETASRYKSEFLANMSHELRTPLNSSLILSKLLADNKDETLTPEQVRYAEAIHASNNDLLALINDILDLAKIEAGRVDFLPELLPLDAVLQRLRETFEPLARQKGLAFSALAAAGAPAQLVTDSQRLQQILKNLLANAVKFTDAGAVSLQVETAGDKALCFTVKDTGIGIPEDQQQVIFEAFRQADGSTSRRFGGTGLGLSISRELAQRMGGSITLTSEPGRGSCFKLELPLDCSAAMANNTTNAAAAAPPALASTVAPALPATRPGPSPSVAPALPAAPAVHDDRAQRTRTGRLILAVEDDPQFAQALLALAHDMDFDCVVAATAEEALRLASELSPSGILLDIGLPDVSGLSVLEQLKRDPRTRHVPVHMVSAMERAQTAMELGAVGYIMKPATREALAGALRLLEDRLQCSMRRLLIVEDDSQLRASLKLLLARDQLEITTVGTLAQALEQLASTSFDCMVTDLSLPDGSGYDLLEQMAANDTMPFPPVIVYTGRALTRDEEQRLRRYSKTIIVKGARSPERLLDEVSLFLHSVEASLPVDQQRLLRQARRRDAVLEGRTLLLAEDDVRNIFALSSVFEPLGVKLEIARNGREALQRLQRDDVDLVLMDVMMPEMDGLTAMRLIREEPRWRHLPIIALTAKAMADDRDRCLEAGANDYIAKPIDVDKLVSLCRVWCPK